jgi:Fe-S-cluster containining protein
MYFTVVPYKTIILNDGKYLYLTRDMKCVFLNRTTRNCVIYKRRPQECKDFGEDESYSNRCPYIVNGSNQKFRHPLDTVKILLYHAKKLKELYNEWIK